MFDIGSQEKKTRMFSFLKIFLYCWQAALYFLLFGGMLTTILVLELSWKESVVMCTVVLFAHLAPFVKEKNKKLHSIFKIILVLSSIAMAIIVLAYIFDYKSNNFMDNRHEFFWSIFSFWSMLSGGWLFFIFCKYLASLAYDQEWEKADMEEVTALKAEIRKLKSKIEPGEENNKGSHFTEPFRKAE